MPSAMVTFNGRITLPTNVRKQLGLKTGDNIDFIEIEEGRFAICPRPAFDPSSDSPLETSSPELTNRPGVRELKETVQ
jgi:AbrB family looped-hinge helix DNA binding protein